MTVPGFITPPLGLTLSSTAIHPLTHTIYSHLEREATWLIACCNACSDHCALLSLPNRFMSALQPATPSPQADIDAMTAPSSRSVL